MVSTARQNRHYATGTLAALDRTKERVTTTLQIDHAPTVDGQALLRAVKHTLVVSGAVDMHRTSIALADVDLQTALQQTQALLEQTRSRLAEAEQKLADVKRGLGGWMSIKDAAKHHGVDYSTMWRAHRAGRLKTVVTGGEEKDQLMCDPTTYRPAAKSKLNKLPK